MTALRKIRPSIEVAIAAPNDTPKVYADYLAEARERQAGKGVASKFLTVTEDELAQADLRIMAWRDPMVDVAVQDEFYRLYGVRRGDDKRPTLRSAR